MMVILRLTCSAQTLQIILNLDHYSAIKTSLYLWAIKYGTNQKHVQLQLHVSIKVSKPTRVQAF